MRTNPTTSMTTTLTVALAATLAAGMVVLALAAPGWAQDTDGDGNVSLAELQAVYPDMTEDAYAAMDTDGDGALSAAEMQAATDAGLLPG